MTKSIATIFLTFFAILLCGCVKEETPTMIGLEIKSYPEQTEYVLGEELDLTGLEVYQVFSDDSKVLFTDYTISYEPLVVGQNEITIHYLDYHCSFYINIREAVTIVKLDIKTLPMKLEFYLGDDLDLTGLEVYQVLSDDTKVLFNDYTISYEPLVLGENEIKINYQGFSCSFSIRVIEKVKHVLNEYPDYSSYTTQSINIKDYVKKIKNVKYGGSRTKDTLIVYDESNRYQTNPYGYEVAINEFGMIIKKGINVEVPKGGFVLSAHGIRVEELKALSVGEFVLYHTDLFVYQKEEIVDSNELYLSFHKLIKNLELIEDIDVYNQCVDEINGLQNAAVTPQELLHLFQEMYSRYQVVVDIYDHAHEYSVCDFNIDIMDYRDMEPNYSFYTNYEGVLHIGGWRDIDMLVYYDATCYRTRNAYGYEVAVDKNGIVVEKDILVSLPEEGYILSGHSAAATFIIENIQLNDKIEIIDGKVSIYRDLDISRYRNSIDLRNQIVQEIEQELEQEIPHDYDYIHELLSKVDQALTHDLSFQGDLLSYQTNNKVYRFIHEALTFIKALLVDSQVSNARGMWYYPFGSSCYDDTSLEGVKTTLTTLQAMGINEVIIDVFYGDSILYDSAIYKKYIPLDTYDYGEYGHDYLQCFISEAHKLSICVNAFTQTFSEEISSLKEDHPEYFQIDFSGEKSMGSIYYYDICSDDVQEILLNWYEELLKKYDFDKVEYDIIRYPATNLPSYSNVEVISDPTKIVDPGYSTYSMNKFMQEYGYQGDLRELIISSKEVRTNWLTFKRENLNNFVRNCTALMKTIKPEIIVTAAVLSNHESASRNYLQDYLYWIENGYIDEVEPMLYTDSTALLISNHKPYFVSDPEYPVRMGLSVKLTKEDNFLDLEQIKIAEEKDGYVLYCSRYYLADSSFIKLLSHNHHCQFVSSINSKEEINKAIIDNIIDVVTNFYSEVHGKDYQDLLTVLQTYDVEEIVNEINNLNETLMKSYLLEQFNNKIK
ncbi:MAG: family 10 glycosylhydrolase [Bacilli bacterium]|nr:family 10 glycosylhydrolase [Bacilli bacterium]